MAVGVSKPAPARGGRRQGAGRPAKPEDERKERIVLYLRPAAAAALRKFQEITSGPDATMPWDAMLQWHLEDFFAETSKE